MENGAGKNIFRAVKVAFGRLLAVMQRSRCNPRRPASGEHRAPEAGAFKGIMNEKWDASSPFLVPSLSLKTLNAQTASRALDV